MTAEEYAKQESLAVEHVIDRLKAGTLPGTLKDGVWYIESYPSHPTPPLYRNGLGESLLDIVSFLLLIAVFIGSGYLALNVGFAVGATTLFQGLIAFAALQGLAGIIKLLKFIAEKVDNKTTQVE